MTCRIDSQSNHWFKCAHGTLGCPRIHEGRTPHCVACTAGEPCQFQHEPPVLEMTQQEYIDRYPAEASHLSGAKAA